MAPRNLSGWKPRFSTFGKYKRKKEVMGAFFGRPSTVRLSRNIANKKPRIPTVSVPGINPAFANVGLLLPFDGTNGDRVTTDLSNNNYTIGFFPSTVAIKPIISTAQSKFGGSSIEINPAGSFDQGCYLRLGADTLDVKSTNKNYTVETWVYLKSLPSATARSYGIFHSGVLGSSNYRSALSINTSNQLRWTRQGASGTNEDIISTATFNTGQWYHVAVVQTGLNGKLFINGNLEAEANYSFVIDSGANEFYIGNFRDGAVLRPGDVYLDDFRVSDGEALYTANFDVPTQAFPTS